MYNINILSECNNEETRVAIIASVSEFLSKNSNSSSFFVNRMKRGKTNTPVWNIVSRQENLNNKF